MLVLIAFAVVPEAQARRMGGGGSIGRTAPSFGKQSGTQAPVAPSRSTAEKSTAAGQATKPAGNRFMGPLGGLIAGLGLAALFSHLGFGEGMANVLGLLLLAGIAFWLVQKLLKGFAKNASKNSPRPVYSGSMPSEQPNGFDSRMNRSTLNSSSPDNGFSNPVVTQHTVSDRNSVKYLPADFREAEFLESAKKFFVTLQGVFDRGDLQAMQSYASDDVLEKMRAEIAARGVLTNHTEVISLDAELLGFERDLDEELATVGFSGVLFETPGEGRQNFNECWVLSRPVSGGGWILAGIHNS